MSESIYLRKLDNAWAQHLTERAPNAPTVISTFAGCGGSSLGYSMAGFRELLATDWDAAALASFRLNFPDIPVYCGDIRELSAEQCFSMTGCGIGELDVLDGSPPCQGFSTAGKRELNDARNNLFLDYVRLLRGLQPRGFIMENVSGLVKGKMRLVFVKMLKELKACGYRVRARLLDAQWYGVPQARKRVIFIGLRDDVNIEPSHPHAQTLPMGAHMILHRGWGPRLEIAHPRPSAKIRMRNEQFRNRWHPATKSCPTIQAARAAMIYEHGIVRTMTWQEAACFQSFPCQFRFAGNDIQSQIGNSVPPLFMRAIAQHMRELLGVAGHG